MTVEGASRESILEPELPIIDPHHHLWDWPEALFATRPKPPHAFDQVIYPKRRYLLHEFLADLYSGHNIRGTVFVQCTAMHRLEGPEHLKPVGETEFVNGIAAMCASGLYGEVRACAGIVGHADLSLGANVNEVLEAHVQAGGGRFRGIRHSTPYDPDPAVLGPLGPYGPGVLNTRAFREGYAQLARHGLSFDAWLLEPQLPELIELVRSHPDTQVVLDHVGTPLGIASYQGRREERFGLWRKHIRELARLPQVSVKLGGLGMPFGNFPSFMKQPPASSAELASEWRSYIEACIEAFGAQRCMFESNFPVDSGACNYPTLWNAFKVLAKDYSAAEKQALFFGTAKRVYKLPL